MSTRGPRTASSSRHLVSAGGALAVTIALAAGDQPGSLPRLLGIEAFLWAPVTVAVWLLGSFAMDRAGLRQWRTAGILAVLIASARVLGLSFEDEGPGPSALVGSPTTVLWTLVELAGTAWVVLCLLVLVLQALDRRADGTSTTGTAVASRGLRRLAASGSSSSVLLITGIVALSRLPYLLAWWPGIIPFDAVRALASARAGEWSLHDPLGHTLLLSGLDRLATGVGIGDTGMVATGAVVQIAVTSAAWAFLLVRMATWGVDRRLWWASLIWIVALPILGLVSVTLVKDGLFAAAFIVLAVGLVEVARAEAQDVPRSAWVTLGIGAALVIMSRNNGLYVVALGLPMVFLLRPRPRRPLLAVVGATVAVAVVYTVVLPGALGARPGPPAESLSLPIQQMGRIAAVHGDTLSDRERDAIAAVFDGKRVSWVARRYSPTISDPIKSQVNDAEDAFSLGTFLRSWVVVASRHPATALDGTLAATAGYWSPGAPSHDGLILGSSNDVRDVVLDIPPAAPEGTVRGWVAKQGVLQEGYRSVPVLGLTASPAVVICAWLVAAVVVARTRSWRLTVPFAVSAVLLLTVLAGPVSGGMRYSLPFYAALPLALALVDLATRRVKASDPPARAT